MVILLTNDDGYQAEGIDVLETVLSQAGHEIWVSAPCDQRSAQSHSMTIHGKVRFVKYGGRHFHCSGSPADCILYGLAGGAIPIKPDLVVSGINHGYNASTDILYSGTVGAASEAALRGIPSIAISTRFDPVTGRFPFYEAAEFLASHLDVFLPLCTPEVLLNINVPPHSSGNWRIGQVGQLEYYDIVERGSSGKSTSFDAASTHIGLAYGDEPSSEGFNVGDEMFLSLQGDTLPGMRETALETDYLILSQGDVSVTPLEVYPVVHAPTCELLAHLRTGV
ncbi:MAG: 5'/3'-nucleotidase SurE [Sphaerochaetaceae bacterium]